MSDEEIDPLDAYMATINAQVQAQTKQDEAKMKKLTNKKRKKADVVREEALNNKISTNNKGFKMLAALGYVEGQGLGKHGTGRTAPIPVNIPTKREGLGQKTLKKQQHIKRVKHEQQSQDDFRRTVRLKQAQAKLRRDLNQAQNACEDLDSRNGITYHSLWPITSQPQPISAQALVQENSSTTSTDRLGDTKLILDSNEVSILDPSKHIRSLTDPLGAV